MNWARARAGHLRLGSFVGSSVRRGMWKCGQGRGCVSSGGNKRGAKRGLAGA